MTSQRLCLANEGQKCLVRLEKTAWDGLRKTARGASSPAKPALHIPDLLNTVVSTFPCVFRIYPADTTPSIVDQKDGNGGVIGAQAS